MNDDILSTLRAKWKDRIDNKYYKLVNGDHTSIVRKIINTIPGDNCHVYLNEYNYSVAVNWLDVPKLIYDDTTDKFAITKTTQWLDKKIVDKELIISLHAFNGSPEVIPVLLLEGLTLMINNLISRGVKLPRLLRILNWLKTVNLVIEEYLDTIQNYEYIILDSDDL